MISLALPAGPLRILCLGAHADDIEIGCGGTILQLLGSRPGCACYWVVLSGGGTDREREARTSADRFLGDAAQRVVQVHQLRDGHFPVALSDLKSVMEGIKREFVPDIVFTHSRDDRHQDHHTVSDVTWQTFRDHFVLEYEIPKWDGDLGQPGLYVPLARDLIARKVAALLDNFPSQRSKRWFREDTFLAVSRLRGVECGAAGGYAEAFYGRKACLEA